MDHLIYLDKQITLYLNSFHSQYFDNFFYLFTQTFTWIPTLLALLFIIVRKWRRQSWIIILLLALSIVLADQISSSIFKPLVMRLRPSHDPALASLIHTVNGYKGGLYGFMSSHAANSFALAVISASIFKNHLYTAFIILWAAANAYSRIYLGIHFLGDILCGATIGIAVSALLYFVYRRVICRHTSACTTTPISTSDSIVFCSTMAANIVIVAAIAPFNLH